MQASQITPPIYDIAIVGGGINGCGLARDAAGRGLSVFLCEKDDLAIGTSSRSTKLIHGGLRYLEHFDFRLVRQSLIEREVLWAIAPHIVRPLRFVLPHQRGLRPAWMLRLGLFLYDHLGGRKRLPGTTTFDLGEDDAGVPLAPATFTVGFEYSDCWVDDARLVVLNARDAADRGAVIRTRTRATAAMRLLDHWQLTLTGDGGTQTVRARILVNAAGPWAEEVASIALRHRTTGSMRLVQGSHIVVPRIFAHERAYIFQNPDGRIVFAIPYEGNFTLIGTTDHDYQGDPGDTAVTEAEISYLCETATACFARPVRRNDVVWAYSGVRPLHDDGSSAASAASRDYRLDLDTHGGAPILSILGGKITIYRRLAEAVLEKLAPHLPARGGEGAGWTGRVPLPGGDFAPDAQPQIMRRLQQDYPFLSEPHALRLVRAYGTRARALLGDAVALADLGHNFGATLTETEVRYLVEQEWATCAEDVLWRRSKLGLHMSPDEMLALDAWMTEVDTAENAPAGAQLQR